MGVCSEDAKFRHGIDQDYSGFSNSLGLPWIPFPGRGGFGAFTNVYKHYGSIAVDLDPRSKIQDCRKILLDPRSVSKIQDSRKNFLDPRSVSKIQDPRLQKNLLGSKVCIQDPRFQKKLLGSKVWIQDPRFQKKLLGSKVWTQDPRFQRKLLGSTEEPSLGSGKASRIYIYIFIITYIRIWVRLCFAIHTIHPCHRYQPCSIQMAWMYSK